MDFRTCSAPQNPREKLPSKLTETSYNLTMSRPIYKLSAENREINFIVVVTFGIYKEQT